MNKLLKIAAYLIAAVVLLLIIALAFLQLGFPKVDPAPELTIEYTPDRIERGAYLANHVTVCMDCHSTRDFSRFSGPPAPGTLGAGGDVFDHSMGLPGVFYAKNITPHGISDYSDGELYRLITTGVTNDGRPMFPLMPYTYYGKMDPEDIYDIIAYVRSLSAIETDIPDSEADFPVNLILRTIPKNAEMTKKPDPTDQVAYGGYLVNASGCVECHTQVDPQGMILQDVKFAGGRSFPFPDGSIVTSSNITQDDETGIGNWNEEMFVQRFAQYADSGYVIPKVSPGEFNTIMPWTMYAGMKKEDLRAIYAYLKTIEPIKNEVVKFAASN
ncbi:c-type cytochrome [Algoriphagus boritolerans]|uniref:Cytochrome c, mono-and diheme variants n=1 Tax=Algoriphagus boritolerans DSM 17298 = JCM 18970 TaxID=1120964 RepID=A0A1H5UVG7_9BACT|nr:cytochrome C [Algoriphagus boritolerans]SEF79065.1 Cytochrome c, mono-and diheme variants [Algoriphagus boritolerans DSM 17298 = JCM 18970]